MDATNRRTGGWQSGWQARVLGGCWAGVLVWVLAGPSVCWRNTEAQVSGIGRGKNFVAPVTDARGRKTVLRGESVKPAGKGVVELGGMKAETYRGREKDMIFEAPQCWFDPKANVASSTGRLSIRTADGRFSIEGESFRWQLGDSGLNSKLVISNRVHSLVRKRLVSAKTGSGPAAAPSLAPGKLSPAPVSSPAGSNASPDDFIDITSDQFDYQADRAVFRGKVRVHEAEGDLSCGVLNVAFRGENGALEKIEAEEEVVLDQGGTRATADKAVYTVGQQEELVEFTGHASWSDGQRQGSSERVTFDRRRRILRSEDRAYLKLPRAALGATSLLSLGPVAPAGTNASAFVEVFSEAMTIQLPPTNGPVQHITAEKSVLIVDPEQEARALADRAEYDEATGFLELTGSPILETERRLVNGKKLRFDRATKVFSASPDAYVKLPLQALGKVGLFPATVARGTNQFIEIWSKEFEYHTNFLYFREQVRANFLEGDRALGKLTCEVLTVRFGRQIESVVAEKAVAFEQFARNEAPQPASRKINCERLHAQFTPEGRLRVAVAEGGVSAEQEEKPRGRSVSVFTRMTSEQVTAVFSALTNQLEKVVANTNVVFVQADRQARGAKAVYTQSDSLMELTGQPTASMPEGQITEAERLIWDRLHERFIGKGKFKSSWKRPPGGGTNVTARASGAR